MKVLLWLLKFFYPGKAEEKEIVKKKRNLIYTRAGFGVKKISIEHGIKPNLDKLVHISRQAVNHQLKAEKEQKRVYALFCKKCGRLFKSANKKQKFCSKC